MRSALLFLFGLLLGACTANSAAAVSPSAPPTYGHVAEASTLEAKTIALVVRSDDAGEGVRAYCSGVWMSDTSLLTANHCVADLEVGEVADYVVRSDVYAPGEVAVRPIIATRPATLYARDAAHDLALLRDLAPPNHAMATLSFEAVRPGVFVQAMGQPLGLWWSYSSGDVAAVRMADPAMGGVPMLFIQSTVPISPGNSGCGLFDAYGQLLGIAHGSYTRGQNANLFIHYQYIDALMRTKLAL